MEDKGSIKADEFRVPVGKSSGISWPQLGVECGVEVFMFQLSGVVRIRLRRRGIGRRLRFYLETGSYLSTRKGKQ